MRLSLFLLSSLSLLPALAFAGGASKSKSEATAQGNSSELVVYSSRKEHLIQPLIDVYEKQAGVQIKLLTDKEGPLIQRIKAEGKDTPADVLITVDAGNLWYAAEQGALQPSESEVLKEQIPAHLRDPEGRWYGLSVRARTMFYNPKKVKKAELSTYEDLANEKWKGRLCLRTSQKVYNQSLVASMIERHGVKKTEDIVEGWVRNLATSVFSDDTSMLEAIAAGQCDVGIANTYYFGRMQKKDPNVNVAVFWPNQESSGVHVNISGAGVVAGSNNPEGALKFIEWLSSPEAQEVFAGLNLEFPANPKVESDPIVKKWGDFKPDSLNVSVLGKRQAEAVKLMDRAKYK